MFGGEYAKSKSKNINNPFWKHAIGGYSTLLHNIPVKFWETVNNVPIVAQQANCHREYMYRVYFKKILFLKKR